MNWASSSQGTCTSFKLAEYNPLHNTVKPSSVQRTIFFTPVIVTGEGGGGEGVEGVRTRRKFAITAEILARSLANFHC